MGCLSWTAWPEVCVLSFRVYKLGEFQNRDPNVDPELDPYCKRVHVIFHCRGRRRRNDILLIATLTYPFEGNPFMEPVLIF